MHRAVEQLMENSNHRNNDGMDDSRLCLLDVKHFNDSPVPTQDTDHFWVQCWRNRESRNGMQLIQPSVKFLRLKQRCRGQQQADLDHDELLNFAVVHFGETCGKWILKTTREQVDSLWGRLALALLNGSSAFGENVTSIKCMTKRGASSCSGIYTLCIYIENGWTQKAEVMRVRETLHKMGVDEHCIQPMYWKPELYTYLPFQGVTYVWIDGKDTDYWYEKWNIENVL
jgi:hypothetical protein